METGERPRWGVDTPQGVALTGHVPSMYLEERTPHTVGVQSDALLPEVPSEEPLCHRDTLMATTEMPQEMPATAEVPQVMQSATEELRPEALPAVPSPLPPAEVGKEPCGVELSSCPEMQGTCPCNVPPITVLVQPKRKVPRGSCLIHNWQEERATNHLDLMPDQEQVNEGFIYRHGHHGLLVQQSLAWPTNTTTMKDHYRPPYCAQMLGQGQREATLQSMFYQKYSRKEMLEDNSSSQMPTKLVSTGHQDHHARELTRQPPSQPHDYHTEQPLSFWLEQARSLPSVTSIRSGDSPFRRNAAFSTPITEYLEKPLSCGPLSSRLWQHKR